MTTLDFVRHPRPLRAAREPADSRRDGFGEDWGWGSDPETSHRLIDVSPAAGGNAIDTANLYTNGHSEKIIGDWLTAPQGAGTASCSGRSSSGTCTSATPTAAAPLAKS